MKIKLIACFVLICSALAAHSQTLNVRSYGAAGDGITNDTAAIQSALDAAAAGGGGVVYLPAGKYLTNSALVIPSKTHLKGDGRGRTSIISPAGDYPGKTVNGGQVYATIALVGADKATVSDLTVDHATNGTTTDGIILIPSGNTLTTNSVVRNVEVLGCNSDQILIWNLQGQGNKILNNYLDGGISAAGGASEEGIEIFGGQDVLVSGNTIRNIGNSSVFVSSAAEVPGSYTKGILVTNNHIENARVGIYVSVNTFDATQIHVQNNIVRNTWTSGIALTTGSGVATSDIAISGNSILNATNEGIRLYGNAGATYSNLSVSNNIVDNVTGATSFGLTVFAISNATIDSNTIRCSSYGFYVAVGSSDVDITNNRVEEQTKNAVLISNATNIEVSGNRFKNYDKDGTGLNYGVYAENLATGRIINNEFKYAKVESYAVRVAKTTSNVRIAQNILNYTPAFTPPFKNDGTSAATDVFYGDVLLPTSSTGLILKDPTTGRRYRLKVSNGVLGADVVP